MSEAGGSLSESAAQTPPSRNQSSGEHGEAVDGVESPEKVSEKVKPLTSPTDRGWGHFPPTLFVGSWTDSLGHSIVVTDSVRANQQCLLAKLTKPGRLRELEIWPKQFSQRQWTWVCGNGSLDWWSSSKSTLWWVTFDGRWSQWNKSKERETPAQVESSASTKDIAQSQPVLEVFSSATLSDSIDPAAASKADVIKENIGSPARGRWPIDFDEEDEPEAVPHPLPPDFGAVPEEVPVTKKGLSASDKDAPRTQRIERVMQNWHSQDPSQMNVSKGEFVDVWDGTETPEGWIYAERRAGAKDAGWLPTVSLKQLPKKQRWMTTNRKWDAKDESQCNIKEGSVVTVWTDSRTSEGWVYVTSMQDNPEASEGMQVGWVPVHCLEWKEIP